MIDQSKLIFIVGVGRSGTSLLQSMVGAHPDVAVSPETHFLRKYLLDFRKHRSGARLDREAMVARVGSDPEFLRVNVPVEILFPPGEEADISLAFLRLATELSRRQGATYYCDKDPNLIDYLPALYHFYPRAKVIHLHRDPRDVVLSKTRAKWSKGRPYWLHAMIGKAQIERGLKAGPKKFGRNFIAVRYAFLLTSPEESLKSLTEQLGLPYVAEMLSFQETAKGLVTSEEESWKKETFGPLMRDNLTKWKKAFKESEIRIIEKLSESYFSTLDYERSQTRGGIVAWMLSRFQPAFQLLYGWIRRNNVGRH